MRIKNKLFLIILLFSEVIFAQVGINNTDPKASLDITAKSSDISFPDGILAPRMKQSELIAKMLNSPVTYQSNQIGAIVYITEIDDASNINLPEVNHVGYYYFDGTTWLSFSTSTSQNSLDIGYIVAWPSNATPPDYLLPLSGGTFNWADYTDFQNFNTTYNNQFIASSTGTTFTLKNVNGQNRFLRGGNAAGLDQNMSTARPTVPFTTDSQGQHQHFSASTLQTSDNATSRVGNLNFTIADVTNQGSNPFSMDLGYVNSTANQGATSQNGNHSHTINNGGDSETRPINSSVIWCVKVKSLSTSGAVIVNNYTGTTNLQAINGLTLNMGNVKLGGALSEPTQITDVSDINKLTITGTGVDFFNVDSNTLSVDATNNRIGIGIQNPSTTLDVVGSAKISNLAGSGTRGVVATADGTLTTGTALSSSPKLYDAVIANDGSGDFNCDGSSDQVEWNAAIASLPSSGGTIFVKSGNYTYNGDVVISSKSNIRILGAGIATIINNNDQTAIVISNSSKIFVENLSMRVGNIVMVNSSFCEFSNLDVRNTLDAGILLDGQGSGSFYNVVRDSYFADNAGVGISQNKVQDSKIINNTMNNNGLEGLTIDNESNRCIVTGNKITANNGGVGQVGIDLSDLCTFSNNIITGKSGSSLAGVTFQNNLGTTNYNVFTNNIIIDNPGGGILLRNNVGGCSRNVLSQNIFRNNPPFSIRVEGNSDRNILVGNTLGGNSIINLGTNTVNSNNQ